MNVPSHLSSFHSSNRIILTPLIAHTKIELGGVYAFLHADGYLQRFGQSMGLPDAGHLV